MNYTEPIPVTREETQHVTITFELKKDLQPDEVVCPHCGGTGLGINDNVYGIKGDAACANIRFPYKQQSISFCKFCFTGVQKKCPGCGALRGRHNVECACGYASKQRRAKWAQDDLDRWKKANKTTFYGGEEWECLYVDNVDRYVFSEDDLESAIDECKDLDPDTEPRIYKTVRRDIFIDSEWVIEHACEDLHEEAASQCNANSLQKLLDAWCEAQDGTSTFYPDYKEGVLLVYSPRG